MLGPEEPYNGSLVWSHRMAYDPPSRRLDRVVVGLAAVVVRVVRVVVVVGGMGC